MSTRDRREPLASALEDGATPIAPSSRLRIWFRAPRREAA
jgi:hypothetical protein